MALAKHVVSQEEWVSARKSLLAKEKALTRARDEFARERLKLPWRKIEADYTFDGPAGKMSLADLFAGRSQLVVYHFMFGPEWKEGCPSCSFICDHLDGAHVHLAQRDVTLTMVSRASFVKIAAFKERMGWTFPWVSSQGSTFNHDFGVFFTPEERATGAVDYNYEHAPFPSAEAPGISVFYKDSESGEIFQTYAVFARGLDALLGAYVILDMVPKGRDEAGLPFSMAWLRHHDRYDTGVLADADRPYWPKVFGEGGKPGREGCAAGCACGGK